MGRKKPAATAAEDENPAVQAMAASKKNKKKSQKAIDDDEYGIVTEPLEGEEFNSVVQSAPLSGKHISGQMEEELMDSLEEKVLPKKKSKGKNAKETAELNGSLETPDADAEELAIPGKKKGKKGKKGSKIEDDEFDVSAFGEKSDEPPQEELQQMEPKFAGKKKVKKSKQDEDEDIIMQRELQNDSGSKTNKKKSGEKSIQSDMFSLLASYDGSDEGDQGSTVTEHADVDEADELVFTGKKKKKKSSKGFKMEFDSDPAVADDSHSTEALDDMVFTEAKKPTAKKMVKDSHEDNFDVQTVDGEEEDELIVFTGKKKGKKGKKDGQKKQPENLILETGEKEVSADSNLQKAPSEEDDDNAIVFSGKKKARGKKNSLFTSSSLDAVLVEDEEDLPHPEVADKTKKKVQKFMEDEDIDPTNQEVGTAPETEAVSGVASDEEIHFTGKKKGKKGKKELKFAEEGDASFPLSADNDPVIIADPQKGEAQETGEGAAPSGEVPAGSKKQKKKKKSGRTLQEEDDLDKILAELGEGPVPLKSTLSEETAKPETVELEPAPLIQVSVDAEAEGVAESAAAKKKKKKKEKEKEKKAAAAAASDEKITAEVKEERQEEPKGKVSDNKKVPKHIREMQERLAKMKEAEEKRKQEEEEKLRKEEEEQRRLEELERQKEEAKRRKKEREKEKLQKKKQEGKLLSGKQKEEARRLALMREQFLAQSGLPMDASKDEQTAAPKKPKYDTKKKRRGPVSTEAAVAEQAIELVDHDTEDQTVRQSNDDQGQKEAAPMEVETVEAELQTEVPVEKVEMETDQEVEEEKEEEDWDAKSWDEADVSLPVKSAFAEEEESPIAKKVTKRVVGPAPSDVVPAKKPAPIPEAKPPAMKNYAAVVSASSKPIAKPAPALPMKPLPVVKKVQKLASPSEEESESEETESEDDALEAKKRKETTMKREARKAEALAKRSAADLRSPICCILGHVDTGKTKLLDCIRRTNVQEGEAGGITQQIGATYFPMDNIRERTTELKADANLRVPGLLVIDTPGHESFSNLRVRGSGLCDIAILVVDIMHGLEPQTIESLNLVKMRQTPFVVALNKVDRLYGWKTRPNAPIKMALKQQSKDVQNEFEMRLSQIMTELKEQGLNSELYFRNKEVRKYVSIVPTSAISGEGVPDLLMLLVQLTQKMMEEKLMYVSEVQCTVLEVKVVEGLGTTIDVILVNGVLHEGDQIVVCGMQGPIVTNIRALLTPHPMKELRIKGSYQHHKELKAAQGIKITGQGLEHAIAGTQLYVVGPDDDLEDIREEAMQDMKNVMSRIDKSGEGVCVQASTLGSLEALLEFLKSPAVNIPVSGISIGPVHKKDVMRASVMLERKNKEYATILAFDVKVTPEARELAEETGVRIFMADIIYHLFDQFKAYMETLKEEKKKEAAEEAIFPCVLKIIPQCVFNKKDPIVLGLEILEGIARVGTPLCVPSREYVDIGKIASIEVNHKAVDSAKKGQKVAMKIIGNNPEEAQKMVGRHFDIEDELVSHITRRSIDLLKENYREDLSLDEWKLVVKLKNLFKIQ
eukprot:Gb_28583 [translate_table: standard]